MADISKLTLPNSSGVATTYNLKDATARTDLATLASSAIVYKGVTTTELYDGSTTTSIIIDDETVTAEKGWVVIYKKDSKDLEFIFNGTKWDEFGSTGALKALAFKDSASGSFSCVEPTGSTTNTLKYDKATSAKVSVPSSFTVSTSASATASAVTISGGQFNYTAAKQSTDKTTIIKATASGTTVTPSGTASVLTGVASTGSATAIKSITQTYKKFTTGSVTGVSGSTTASKLSSAGSVTAGSDAVITAGTLPTFTAAIDSSDTENLVFTFTQGTKSSLTGGKATKVTLPTFTSVTVPVAASATTIVTGVTSATDSSDAQFISNVAASDTFAAITGVGASGTNATAITGISVTAQPTVVLATDTTTGDGKVSITSQQWSTQTTVASLSGTSATVKLPDTITATNTDTSATITTTSTAATGSVTVGTTTTTHTVTVS